MTTQVQANRPFAQMSEGQFMSRLAKAYRTAKRKVLDINDDPEIVERVRHVMKPNEKLGEFIARTGLGRASILEMSRDQIRHFVAQAETTNSEQGFSIERFRPRPIPMRMMIETAAE